MILSAGTIVSISRLLPPTTHRHHDHFSRINLVINLPASHLRLAHRKITRTGIPVQPTATLHSARIPMRTLASASLCLCLISCDTKTSNGNAQVNAPSIPQKSSGRVSETGKKPLIGAAERLINESGVKDGKSLYKLICDQYKGNERARVCSEAFAFLGAKDPHLAVELLKALPEGNEKYALFSMAISACFELKSLKVLLHGVGDIDSESRSQLFPSLHTVLDRLSSDDLTDLADSVPLGWRTTIDTMRFRAMGKEGAVEKFDTLLSTMSAWSRRQANEDFIAGLARNDVATALSRLRETPDPLPSPEISSLVAGTLYAEDREKGLDVILSGEDSKINQDLLKSYVRIWFHASSEELSRYLNTLPPSSRKDAILLQFINHLDRTTEAEEINAWKNQFQNASLRDESGSSSRPQTP